MKTGAVCSLAVVGLLLAAGSAAADPPAEEGEQLVESGDPGTLDRKVHRLACGSQFCAWHISEYMGGCSGEDCSSHDLVVSDRKGRALQAITTFPPGSTVRFLGPRQLELVTPSDLITHNAGGKPWDAGIDATLMMRRLLTVSADGAKFESDSQSWVSPERQKKLQRLLFPSSAAEEPGLRTPVSDALRAKAEVACGVLEESEALHHECRKGTCFLVLGQRSEEGNLSPVCVVEVKGKQVKPLPIDKLVDGADEFSLAPSRYCVVMSSGGIRGGPGDEQCISRDQPGRMAFVETKGLHLEGGRGYPVRKAGSVAAGRELAPTVHAFTAAHVSWGLEAWKGEKDLSLTWQAMRAGDALQLHVEVDDDALVPLGEGAAVHSDHLELDFWGPQAFPHEKKGVLLKLGALLAGDGKVQVRVWKRGRDAQDRDVDEAYAATGTWARTPRGYAVDLSLPVESLRKELATQRPWDFRLMASDADEKGRQETLLGTRGSLRFWDEYPPTIEEYLRTAGRD